MYLGYLTGCTSRALDSSVFWNNPEDSTSDFASLTNRSFTYGRRWKEEDGKGRGGKRQEGNEPEEDGKREVGEGEGKGNGRSSLSHETC